MSYVVITGANRGIGRAVVERFAKDRDTIFACARCQNDVFARDMSVLAEKSGAKIHPLYFDLTKSDEMAGAAAQIRKYTKTVDVLVNNAGGIPGPNRFVMTSPDEFRDIMEINFIGPMIWTQYMVRMMMRNKSGAIVFLSSVAALDGEPGELSYCASKGAVASAVKKLAIELGPDKIRVNGIAPGLIDTDMGNAISEELENNLMAHTTLNRRGTVAEVAEAVHWLTSKESSYMTGQILRIDGGIHG